MLEGHTRRHLGQGVRKRRVCLGCWCVNTRFVLGLRTRRGTIVSASRWLEIFRSPFYIGRVYDVEDEYEGAHPRLISDELFERVQNVIAIRDYAGPRQYRHFHHLKGTL